MELNEIKQVYLVGIGGIGMSGLARYFRKRGSRVAGYDRTQTTLTLALESEGIDISYEDDVAAVPAEFAVNSNSLLVIYTPAVPGDAAILSYFRNGGFNLKKRSEVLGIISAGMFTIAVAGTHGKTTTSTILAHILKNTGYDCTAFLGGIASNYDTNVLLGSNNVVVIEADEYDRSFLRLYPDIAVITSMDADHLDIYGDADSVKESFRLFASQLKEGGKLIRKAGLELEGGISYSAAGKADVYADNITIRNGTFFFDFISPEVEIRDVELGLPGLHNIENATAAIRAVLALGVRPEGIREALRNFRGVKRRFEYIIRNDRNIFIDDYAHHPEELRACITSVKRLYPEKKLTVVFQPHLYSRTRDFAEGFAEVLDMADTLLLLDIYPARELPVPGVSSAIIADKMRLKDREICRKDEAAEFIKKRQPELLLTVGAGDIDTLIEPFKNILENA